LVTYKLAADTSNILMEILQRLIHSLDVYIDIQCMDQYGMGQIYT